MEAPFSRVMEGAKNDLLMERIYRGNATCQMLFYLSHEILFVHYVRRAIAPAAVDHDMGGKGHDHAPALFLPLLPTAPEAIRNAKGDAFAGFEIFEHALQYSIC